MLKLDVVGKNIDISEKVYSHIEKKLRKIDKFVDETNDVRIVIEKQRHNYRVEAFFKIYEKNMLSSELTSDLYASIDGAIEKIEKQIRRFKTRFKPTYTNEGQLLDVEERESVEVIQRPINKKPMILDEAIMQLELSSDIFLAFKNVKTDKVNVLYKREDGNYGLITPE